MDFSEDAKKIVLKTLQGMRQLREDTVETVAGEVGADTECAERVFLMTGKFEVAAAENTEALVTGLSCGFGYLAGGFNSDYPVFRCRAALCT